MIETQRRWPPKSCSAAATGRVFRELKTRSALLARPASGDDLVTKSPACPFQSGLFHCRRARRHPVLEQLVNDQAEDPLPRG
jgi:hypothetical protein